MGKIGVYTVITDDDFMMFVDANNEEEAKNFVENDLLFNVKKVRELLK